MEEETKVDFKCVLQGSTGTGKSSFIASLLQKTFLEEYRSTIGASFSKYQLFSESTTINMNFWDVSGAERFASLYPLYYRDADACIFFYDITNLQSFKKIDFYIESVASVNSRAKLFVLGNKTDLNESREVIFEEAKMHFDQMGVMFWEISCKENLMIENTAKSVALSLLSLT